MKNLLFVFLLMGYLCQCQSYIPNFIAKKSTDSLKNISKNKGEEWFKVNSGFLYGGGLLYGIITADENVEESTSPGGSIGFNFQTNRLATSLFFTYNGDKTIDIDNLSQFGAVLMNPYQGGQSISLSVMGNLDKENSKYGFVTSFLAADNIWKIDENTEIEASPILAKLGFFYFPFEFDFNNNVNIGLELKYTHRAIYGDFGNNDQVIDGTTIKRIGYNGLEFSLNTYLNKVKLFFNFSVNGAGDVELPGLTGNQLTFGIDVLGDIFKLKK